MYMHAIAQGSVRTPLRESALKVDSERKIPCRTGESNVRQQCAGPMLYQLSYIPTPGSICLGVPGPKGTTLRAPAREKMGHDEWD